MVSTQSWGVFSEASRTNLLLHECQRHVNSIISEDGSKQEPHKTNIGLCQVCCNECVASFPFIRTKKADQTSTLKGVTKPGQNRIDAMTSSRTAYSKVSVHANDDLPPETTGGQLLQESLVDIPSAAVATSIMPMLQVTAPTDLPEGYELDATIGGDESGGGTVIKVQVPPGGVERGQAFSVPFPTHVESRLMSTATIRVPVGTWRDGFFEFYKYGVCHPHCWTACCCSTCMFIAMDVAPSRVCSCYAVSSNVFMSNTLL